MDTSKGDNTAVLLGLASFIDGIVQGYTGLSVLVTNVLYANFSSFLTLWLLIMGILMWRAPRPV